MLLEQWLENLSDILPIVAIIIYYRRFDSILKIVAIFLTISALSDATITVFLFLRIPNNCPILHIYLMASIIILGVIYYRAFFDPFVKKIVLWSTVLVFLISIVNVIFIEHFLEFPSITNTALSLMLIIFSLMYFYQLLSRQEFVHIEKQSLFWINTAVLFYYSVTIFLFMLYKKLSHEEVGQYFVINLITNIIANLLYTVGVLCKPENAKAQTDLK